MNFLIIIIYRHNSITITDTLFPSNKIKEFSFVLIFAPGMMYRLKGHCYVAAPMKQRVEERIRLGGRDLASGSNLKAPVGQEQPPQPGLVRCRINELPRGWDRRDESRRRMGSLRMLRPARHYDTTLLLVEMITIWTMLFRKMLL